MRAREGGWVGMWDCSHDTVVYTRHRTAQSSTQASMFHVERMFHGHTDCEPAHTSHGQWRGSTWNMVKGVGYSKGYILPPGISTRAWVPISRAEEVIPRAGSFPQRESPWHIPIGSHPQFHSQVYSRNAFEFLWVPSRRAIITAVRNQDVRNQGLG